MAAQADPNLAWHEALFGMLWSPSVPAAFAHPGWSVYRNTTQRACLQALRANFPALAVLLGESAFEMLSRAYMAKHPPEDARLLHYGSHLASFLATFEPARDWPHLVDVAWLDRAWIESHVAPDAPILSPGHLLQKSGVDSQQVCPPHPATRWISSPTHPIAQLWLDARLGLTQRPDLTWQGEALMLTRTENGVQGCQIQRADVAFLQACAKRQSLECALAAAWQADASADLSATVSKMLGCSALTHGIF